MQVGSAEDGERIDRLLARRLQFKSRTQVQMLLLDRRITVYPDWQQRGVPVIQHRPAARVRAGQLVVVNLDAPFVDGEADSSPLTLRKSAILYEDDALIAIDKASGCAIHPTRSHRANSLLEQVHRYQAEAHQTGRATPCHRLDRETSGVVLFAKTSDARSKVGRLFEGHKLAKSYQAIVAGLLLQPTGVIDTPIGRDTQSNVPIRQATVANGQSALTRYRSLSTNTPTGSQPQCTLLELKPATGRQHQLRVHLAAIGHPILGDSLYTAGDSLFLRAISNSLTDEDLRVLQSPRLALHATSLSFPHPSTNRQLTISSPLPTELRQLSSVLARDPSTTDVA